MTWQLTTTNSKFDNDNKHMHLVHCNFYGHGIVPVCYGAHRPMRCEATGRSNWSSIHSVSLRRLPWSWQPPWSLYCMFVSILDSHDEDMRKGRTKRRRNDLTMMTPLTSCKLPHKLREPTLLNLLLSWLVLVTAAGFASCLKEWQNPYHSGISLVPLECTTWHRYPLLM